MDVFSIKRDFADLKRLGEIVTILAEEGFHSYIAEARLSKHAALKSKLKRKKHIPITPEHARETLERLGPTFVKLGQVLSLRPDLVPVKYCEEFKKLQSHSKPLPFSTIQSVIEAELGKPLNKIFKKFSEKPLASASIAQAHRATLMDGTEVVAKVQRPGIVPVMKQDIDIMLYIAAKIDKSKYKNIHATNIVEEFKEYTERELNFKFELGNIRLFAEFFKKDKKIIIPAGYTKYSTEKLLVMEHIDGVPLTNKKEILKRFKPKELSRTFTSALISQVMELNAFHADPHPGNLIAVKPNKIAFIDFGIVGFLSDEIKNIFIGLLLNIMDKDVRAITKTLLAVGKPGPNCDSKAFEERLTPLIMSYNTTDLKNNSIAALAYQVTLLAIDEDIAIPSVFMLTAKAVFTMESTAVWLYPKFNATKEARPMIQKILSKRSFADDFKKDLMTSLPEIKHLAEELPEKTEHILQKLEKGEFKVSLDKQEIANIGRDYDLEMNKRNTILLAGILFIGGALLAGLAPTLTLLGQPLYGWSFVLFIVALFMYIHQTRKTNKYWQ